MRTFLTTVALLATTALTSPASAATLDPSDVGQVLTLNYSGTYPNGNQVSDLTAVQVITLDTFNALTNTFSFSYTMTNTSSGIVTSSRLTGFGFDTAPELDQANSGATITDLFGNTLFTQQISGGINVDICMSAGNCSGSGSEGLLIGASTTGTFVLDFADGITPNIIIDEFTARFQSIAGSPLGTSGIAGGNPGGGFINPVIAPPVPIPPAAALFLSGLAGLGVLGWRKRRKQQPAATPA